MGHGDAVTLFGVVSVVVLIAMEAELGNESPVYSGPLASAVGEETTPNPTGGVIKYPGGQPRLDRLGRMHD